MTAASTWVMYALLVFYVVIMACAAWERNWWRALYFFAAILIGIAVLGMTWESTKGAT
jgi:drug/metabolite transporter (DMT)-like permease